MSGKAPLEPDPPFGEEAPAQMLRGLRKRAGLSLKAVAERIGGKTHFTTIAKLESGKMVLTYDWARRLSRVFDIPAGQFFLPERRNDAAHLVPIYSAFDPETGKPDGVVESYASYVSARDDLIALFINGPSDIIDVWPHYSAIIDPNKNRLVVDVLSAFILVGSASPIVGIFRLFGERNGAILPWPQAERTPIVLDPADVRVVGWVLELQRTVIGHLRDGHLGSGSV